jgi:uncharacterized protein (DUF697 family)
MTKLCRDQAREELPLLVGGGAAAGVMPIPFFFTAGITLAQIAVVNRIARIYGADGAPAGGGAALAGAVMIAGGADLLSKIAGEVAGWVPFVERVIKPALGAGATWAFGEAAIAYFENLYPNQIYSSTTSSADRTE